MKVLLAEDDEIIGELVRNRLELEKFTVDWLQDGLTSEHAALNFNYDVIVIDLSLPRKNGVDIIQHLREKKCHSPILILTTNNTTKDRIEGLQAGADDYLSKPFNYDEMIARLRALVRREKRAFSEILSYEEITLNLKTHEVTFQGNTIDLGRREYALLEILMSNKPRIVTRKRLIDAMYGFDEETESNVLEVHISSLRKKFSKSYIRTVRGIGYKMK